MVKPILVLGSLNMDFVVRMPQLPVRGETLTGSDFHMLPGGKGANQACAAGRLGGQVKMIGRVGADIFGEQLRASLHSAGVDTGFIWSTAAESTGVALIFVETGGQNMIVIAAGANARLSPADLTPLQEHGRSGYLLLQLESPADTVSAAAAMAHAAGMTVILDPAPARPLTSDLLSRVDLLTPNETEALTLLGRPAQPIERREAGRITEALRQLGPRIVILKLGSQGVWLDDGEMSVPFAAPLVEAVDATAAGDTFNGALAVALAEGKSMVEAIPFAVAAASLSVTRLGAQASIPLRTEVEAFRRAQGI